MAAVFSQDHFSEETLLDMKEIEIKVIDKSIKRVVQGVKKMINLRKSVNFEKKSSKKSLKESLKESQE